MARWRLGRIQRRAGAGRSGCSCRRCTRGRPGARERPALRALHRRGGGDEHDPRRRAVAAQHPVHERLLGGEARAGAARRGPTAAPHGERLIGFFELIFPGSAGRWRSGWRRWPTRWRSTPTSAASRSTTDSEDGIGRLSMWRAYSGGGGVAFVLKNRAAGRRRAATRSRSFTGPVEYAGRRAFFERFGRFVDGMLAEGEYIAGLGAERACRALVGSYHFAALSTKHPGVRRGAGVADGVHPGAAAGGRPRAVGGDLPRRAAGGLQAAAACRREGPRGRARRWPTSSRR